MRKHFSISSLRSRLLLLIFFAGVPALGVAIENASQQQRQAVTGIRQEVQRLTYLAASNQDQFIEKVHQFLLVLARSPEIRQGNSDDCATLMVDLFKQNLPYANFGVADLQGNIFCSALPLANSMNIAERIWFQRTLETNNFAVGNYQIGRLTNQPVIVFSYPIRDDNEQVQSVIFASVSLKKIHQITTATQLPPDAAITLIDHKGTILARHPHPEQWVGKSLAQLELIQTILQQRQGEVESLEGLDQVERFYAFSPLKSVPSQDIYLAIGISKATAIAQANQLLLRSLAGIGFVGALMLAIAWIGSDVFILRRVKALVRATQQLKAGNLGTRVGVTNPQGELNLLAYAFDEMAETLQKRAIELNKINRALRTLSDCNQALVRATDESSLLQNICEILVKISEYHSAWVTFAQPENSPNFLVVATVGLESTSLENAIAQSQVAQNLLPLEIAMETRQFALSKTLPKNSAIAQYFATLGSAEGAWIALPLIGSDQVLGTLNLYSLEADGFDPAEINLLQELADDMAYGLKTLRSHLELMQTQQQLQQAKDELEIQVFQRTEQLQKINEKLEKELRDRAQIQADLQASQSRLAGILDIAKDAIISIDKNQKITLFNQGAEKIFGYSAAEILGEPLDILLPARFSQVHRRHVEGFGYSTETARKMSDRSEIFGRRKDGTEFLAEASISQLILADEKIFTVILRDITERKESEVAISRLAAIVESSHDAICSKNLAGIILSWNAAAQEIYGYSAAEMIGHPISILIPPEFHQEFSQIMEKISQGQPIESYETVRLRKDGERIDISLTISPIKDILGNVVAASSISRDITERKRVEKRLEQLRHQNDLILNAAADGIYGLDRQGKTTFINPSAARMLGYEVSELMGQYLHPIIHHSKSDRTPYPWSESPLYATFQDGSIHRVNDEVFWRKDGTCFSVEYVSTPIQEQDQIVGAVVTFQDITERRAIEQMKDEFISVVSHELRTPLTSIRTSLGLLTSGLLQNQPEKARWMLDIAMESTNRLVRLVNDILDLERIESGKITMHKEMCHLETLMTKAINGMQATADKAGVTLCVYPKSLQLYADSDRVIQTLTNLLSNAIKFSPSGSKVELNVEFNGEEIVFKVQDWGRGIPADKLETIFDRFQQVDVSDSRKQGGTGLGLAICRTIVQQHGGKIWAESRLGAGSIFYVTFPLMTPAEEASQTSKD